MIDMPTSIGRLRWLVTLAQRNEVPDFDTGITENLVEIGRVYADIRPIGNQVFFNGEQTDSPVTHQIYMRWRDYNDVNFFNVIIRELTLPDGGVRNEIFRIRSISEWEGRKRFLSMECELERFDESV